MWTLWGGGELVFEDNCLQDQTSQYNLISTYENGYASLTFSNNGYYIATVTQKGNSFFEIPDASNKTGIKVRVISKRLGNANGFQAILNNTSYDIRCQESTQMIQTVYPSSNIVSPANVTNSSNNWYVHELILTDNCLTYNLYDETGENLINRLNWYHNLDITSSQLGFTTQHFSGDTHYYKNIKVELV